MSVLRLPVRQCLRASLVGLALLGLPTRACTATDHAPIGPTRAPTTSTGARPGLRAETATTVASPPSTAPPRATATTRPPVAAPGTVTVTVYYPRRVGTRRYLVPERHELPATDAVATAAVRDLVTGRPRYPGSTSPFPPGSRLRGLWIKGDTAVVDLSREALRGQDDPDGQAELYALQALAWTATQFPSVTRVRVTVEGRSSGTIDGRPVEAFWGRVGIAQPLVREPSVALAPIALSEPAPRARVDGSRVVVKGEASVAEGTVSLRLLDQTGQVVAQGYATAERGAPRRGAFSGALSFKPPATEQLWTAEAFEASPADGSVTYSVAVPVLVGG